VRLGVSGARNRSWEKTGLDDGAIHQIKHIPRRQECYTFCGEAQLKSKQKEFTEFVKYRRNDK
jgi:hypothetical protein